MPSNPTGQLPGDYLRDQWFHAMEVEAARRGWSVRIGAPVGKLMDNTTFTLDLSPADSSICESVQADTNRSRVVRGLIHASTSWRGWGVSLSHMTDLEQNYQRTGERYVVLLLYGTHDLGAILYRRDVLPWTQEIPIVGQLEITRDELEGLTWFDSISSCASFLGHPEPPSGSLSFSDRRVRIPPARSPEHHLSPNHVHNDHFCPHGQLLRGMSLEGGLRAAPDGCWIEKDIRPSSASDSSHG